MKHEEYRHFVNTNICNEARAWLETQSDILTAWTNCKRGDWMWYALENSGKATLENSVAFARMCLECVDSEHRVKQLYYANLTEKETDTYDASTFAAYVSLFAFSDRAGWQPEAERQADWIRENIKFPFAAQEAAEK